MFQRFSDTSRNVVVDAQSLAREMRHNFIGTEHLVLALYRQDGPTAEILAAAVSHTRMRAEVLEALGQGDVAPTGHIPFTPHAKAMLELSLKVAVEWEHDHIAPQELAAGWLHPRLAEVPSRQVFAAHTSVPIDDVVEQLKASHIGKWAA